MAAVSEIAPAFEIIEDRRAVYRETRATSLIADNAWSGGVVARRHGGRSIRRAASATSKAC